jgi:hypothetical protein
MKIKKEFLKIARVLKKLRVDEFSILKDICGSNVPE